MKILSDFYNTEEFSGSVDVDGNTFNICFNFCFTFVLTHGCVLLCLYLSVCAAVRDLGACVEVRGQPQF